MNKLAATATFLMMLLGSLGAFAQDSDARVAAAVELFEASKFVDAAKLFEEIERTQPANYLRLNAMVSWYKADRCVEARAAMARIVDDSTLEPPDRQDIDKIGAYCSLKDAREHAREGRLDQALATVDAVETENLGMQQEIATFRAEIEARKQAEIDAKAEANKPFEPPPNEVVPAPASRPRWAWFSGLALTGSGVALAVATAAKAFSDENAIDKGTRRFAEAYRCDYNDKENTFFGCSDDRKNAATAEPAYRDWVENDVKVAQTATRVMGVSAGVLGLSGLGLLTYYWLSGPGDDQRAIRVAPIIGPHTVSAVMELRF